MASLVYIAFGLRYMAHHVYMVYMVPARRDETGTRQPHPYIRIPVLYIWSRIYGFSYIYGTGTAGRDGDELASPTYTTSLIYIAFLVHMVFGLVYMAYILYRHGGTRRGRGNLIHIYESPCCIYGLLYMASRIYMVPARRDEMGTRPEALRLRAGATPDATSCSGANLLI